MPHKIKRSEQGLYEVESLTLTQEEYQRNFGAFLDPSNYIQLLLNEEEDGKGTYIKGYRPLTPIQHAIKKAPTNLDDFCSLVEERLPITQNDDSITSQEQKELADILIAEIRALWPDIRKQAPDPFLNNEENKEMYREIAIAIVVRISSLFDKYKAKAAELKNKGVFSSRANISRLKTQLADEAANQLDILKVRRKVLDIMNSMRAQSILQEDSSRFVHKKSVPKSEATETTNQETRVYPGVKAISLQRELKAIGAGNTNRKMTVMSELEQKLEGREARAESSDVDRVTPSVPPSTSEDTLTHYPSKSEAEIADDQGYIAEHQVPQERKLQRSKSCLELIQKDDTFEDFHLDDVKKDRKISIHRLRGLYEPEALEEQANKISDDYLATDLERLVKSGERKEEDHDPEIDLPPLMQVYRKRKPKSRETHSRSKNTGEAESGQDSEEESEAWESSAHPTRASSEEIDLFSARLTSKLTARAYNVRVSHRIFKSALILQPYPVMFNEFKREVDENAIKHLDNDLFAVEELREVYDEISGTLLKKHFDIDRDPYVEKCLGIMAPMDNVMSDCQHRKLFSSKTPDAPHCPVFIPRTSLAVSGPLFTKSNLFSKPPEIKKTERPNKSYTSWLAWWRSAISKEDYYKYLMIQDTDFLDEVFHLDELRAEREAAEEKKSRAEGERQKKKEKPVLSASMIEKTAFASGFWNPKVVLLGGLGRDPENENFLQGETQDLQTPAIGTAQTSQGITVGKTGTPPATREQRSQSLISSLRACLPVEEKAQVVKPLTVQCRLERIWKALKMTENDRLDMALKYSSDEHLEYLPKLVEKLEFIADLVTSRESVLADLENFEKTASDPNRFFEKGPRGRSSARQKEELTRTALHKKLMAMERKLQQGISSIEKVFDLEIKYEGRSYLNKMENDKVEMLFWLQQERRKQVLANSSGRRRQSSISLPSMQI